MSMARHTLDVEYVSMWACHRDTEVTLDVECPWPDILWTLSM